MPTVYRDGKRLSSAEADKFISSNPQLFGGGGSSGGSGSYNGGGSPVTGAPVQAKKTSGGGNKGGRDPIKASDVEGNQYNKDTSYGYYGPKGNWVTAWEDMRDGGGQNRSGNYFVGGGAVSSLLNALKIRPAGAAREKDPKTGKYLIDRADIGYRNFQDMYDRGGPQAAGGKFMGAGKYSGLANFILGEEGERKQYVPVSPYLQQLRQQQQVAPVNTVNNINNTQPVTTEPVTYTPTGGTIPATGYAVGALTPLPQTGLLNQYQSEYENIPVATSTANQGTNISVDQMRTALQAVGDPAWNHKHDLVVQEAYNRMMGR